MKIEKVTKRRDNLISINFIDNEGQLCALTLTPEQIINNHTNPPNNAIQDELLPSEASQTELRKMSSAGQKIKNHSQSS